MKRNTSSLIIYAVLGTLVLGMLPAAGHGLVFVAAAQTKDVSGTGVKASAPVKVNTAPLREFLVRTNRLKEQGKLDLSAPREITIDADRDEAGLLSNVAYTGASLSNPNFKKVAQDFVVSLNTSHALNFLQDVSHVRMTFTLDGEHFRALTASDTPSDTRAAEMARGYRSMINIGRIMKRGGSEAIVLNNMKVSASGKQLVMNLDMSREAMGNLLLKHVTPH